MMDGLWVCFNSVAFSFFSPPPNFAALFAWWLLNKLMFGIQCNKREPGFIRRNPKQNPLKLVGDFSLVSFGIDGHKLTCASSLWYSTVVILM